jgi:hypothetical protein
MNVGDYFTQGRQGWVRLRETGDQEHEVPCPHKKVAGWLQIQEQEAPFLSVVAWGEIRKGFTILLEGKHRAVLEVWLYQELLT